MGSARKRQHSRRTWPRMGALTACVVAMGLFVSPAGATVFRGGPVIIPESGVGNPYPSTIAVSGQGYVTDVDVRLSRLTHSFSEDLDLLVVGPQGQSALILSDVAGGDGLSRTLTFSDQAAGPADPSVSGTYQPTNADDGSADLFPSPAPFGPFGSALSGFNETDANGTWLLYVNDDDALDSGSIGEWWVDITDRQRRSVRFSGREAREGEIATVTVTREPAGHPASVGYTTGGDRGGDIRPEATPGGDYQPVSGSLQFGEGETSKSFTIPLVRDDQRERIEVIPLNFTSLTGDARADRGQRLAITDGPPVTPLSKPRLSGPKVQRVLKQRGVVVHASLPIDVALTATGSIALPRAAAAAATVRLTAAKANLKAGKRARLKLKLTRKAARSVKRAFRKRRRLSAKILVKSKDRLGRKTSSRMTVRLKR